MSDLIRREDALQAIVDITTCENAEGIEIHCDASVADSEGWLGGVRDALRAIENVPSAEPERTVNVKRVPYAEEMNYDSDGECECGKWVDVLWNYCPRCGAKLDWSE